ncbi:MAG: radical SAM protein [Gammaproteobacteria bacterium]|nr:radical SAM protein [Gammaproteobacteria bacterium]
MRFTPYRHLPAVLWKRRPIQLTFFVTRRCNARCPFCFYLNGDGRDWHRGQELTLEEIRRISHSFGSLLWLAFSGGEPYVRRDLAEIARVFYEQNRPAMMLLPTNGLTPELIRDRTEEILARCPHSTVVVKLSLDGLNGDHDALRGTPGGFERVMRSHRLLAPLLDRYSNFELGINTVLVSDNQDKMDQVIDFVRDLPGIRTHTISLVRGNVAEPRYTEVDAASYQRAIERLKRELKEPGAARYRFRGGRLKAAQDILQRQLIHRTRAQQRRQIPCYAGRLNLVLTENGEVYPCEIRSETLGNVRECDYDVNRLLRGAASRSVLDSIRRGECHCTHECYFITNILFNPRLYPALVREYLELGRSPRAWAGGAARPAEQPTTGPQPEQTLDPL